MERRSASPPPYDTSYHNPPPIPVALRTKRPTNYTYISRSPDRTSEPFIDTFLIDPSIDFPEALLPFKKHRQNLSLDLRSRIDVDVYILSRLCSGSQGRVKAGKVRVEVRSYCGTDSEAIVRMKTTPTHSLPPFHLTISSKLIYLGLPRSFSGSIKISGTVTFSSSIAESPLLHMLSESSTKRESKAHYILGDLSTLAWDSEPEKSVWDEVDVNASMDGKVFVWFEDEDYVRPSPKNSAP